MRPPRTPQYSAARLAFSALLLILTILAPACGGAPGGQAGAPKSSSAEPPSAIGETIGAEPAAIAPASDPEPGTAVPVGKDDPQQGDPMAPVTWVVYSDFQCPYCARLVGTMRSIRETYGPDVLRIVWKDNPLPFHAKARPAHIAGAVIYKALGNDAFWHFHELAYSHQKDLTDDNIASWAQAVGLSRTMLEDVRSREVAEERVARSIALGHGLGVTGTPASFLNGVFLSGAQPRERFEAIIRHQIELAAALRRQGVPPERVYAQLSDENYRTAPKRAPRTQDGSRSLPQDDVIVWRVPLGSSPSLGNPRALVTIVEFGDYSCTFCKQVQVTLAALQTRYGDKLRIVWKDNPLPFHPRAEPAAELAREARASGGDEAFFRAHDLLFAHQEQLEDADLVVYAGMLGLDAKRVQAAIAKRQHAKAIETDQVLAEELNASGIPHFFINGRRLIGAQPEERFAKIIDEEIRRAEGLLSSGTKADKIYEALQKDARNPPPPERIVAPKPTRADPSKGSPGAPVSIQMFADYQCPYSRKVQATVAEVMAKYPGKVRVVFRHRPLPMHAFAEIAAAAAMEAFAQKGNDAFWAMSERLFAEQDDPHGYSRDRLTLIASEVGLDVKRFDLALDSKVHDGEIQAAKSLADDLHVSGTPAFAIGDYYLAGAQSAARMGRLVERALGPREPVDPASIHGELEAGDSPAKATLRDPVAGDTLFGAKHLLVMYAGSTRASVSITRTKDEAKARAEEARVKLMKGASWAAVVRDYSDEPGAAERQGDLGSFPIGAMVPDFQAGLERLRVGELSAVVETTFGFHLIWRTR